MYFHKGWSNKNNTLHTEVCFVIMHSSFKCSYVDNNNAHVDTNFEQIDAGSRLYLIS